MASARATALRRAEWLAPAGLIVLSIVPALAGTMRLLELGAGAPITPDNARFFAAPLPVLLHIVGSLVYCVLGAFQFAPGLRRRWPGWHRTSGHILLPCGLAAALSGLWMTQFYPRVAFDGTALYLMRLLVGVAMSGALVLGLVAARRREFPAHRAWMMRAYALGLGAGTQVLTHLPWLLAPDLRSVQSRALFMGAGWAINLLVAEYVIARGAGRPRPSPPGPSAWRAR